MHVERESGNYTSAAKLGDKIGLHEVSRHLWKEAGRHEMALHHTTSKLRRQLMWGSDTGEAFVARPYAMCLFLFLFQQGNALPLKG